MPDKSTTIKDVLNNIKQIYMTDSSISTLLDFERVIDELDLYVFDHWKQGELIEGPRYEKYFVTCKFMWPHKHKPDTTAAKRLAEYGCVVRYKKDVLDYNMKIKTPMDFQPGTKLPKIGKIPVWVVTITMPKKLMRDIHQGSLELESSTVDADDIETSYEEGMDDKMYQTDQSLASGTDSQQTPPAPATGAPAQ